MLGLVSNSYENDFATSVSLPVSLSPSRLPFLFPFFLPYRLLLTIFQVSFNSVQEVLFFPKVQQCQQLKLRPQYILDLQFGQ